MIAAATALVLLGGSIVPFLNPVYVRFEQDRTGAAALTGYSPDQLDEATGAILHDLVFGGDFVFGVMRMFPQLNDREREHMQNVRGVFAGFFALAAAALVVLLFAFRRTRAGTDARAAVWRSVAGGARGLAIGIAVAGIFLVLAFDAAFEVFHRLFFSAGSYTFDPRTDKLVQLFPEAFWSETATFVGIAVLVASVVTFLIARRRARGRASSAAGAA